jgi:hypothetical protein
MKGKIVDYFVLHYYLSDDYYIAIEKCIYFINIDVGDKVCYASHKAYAYALLMIEVRLRIDIV